jgi:hypothetical protein
MFTIRPTATCCGDTIHVSLGDLAVTLEVVFFCQFRSQVVLFGYSLSRWSVVLKFCRGHAMIVGVGEMVRGCESVCKFREERTNGLIHVMYVNVRCNLYFP